ncbi:hypothetical protein WJX74_006545 [Apatococcus lobatus]|uniref:Uncharacterized protein n=1 Tax=Apatococcus lobatus TaxID=904363 RepID=A0AAW1RAA3_9CHLO
MGWTADRHLLTLAEQRAFGEIARSTDDASPKAAGKQRLRACLWHATDTQAGWLWLARGPKKPRKTGVAQLRGKDLILLAGVALLQKAEEDNRGAQDVSRIIIQALQVPTAQQIWSLDLEAVGLPFQKMVWLVATAAEVSAWDVIYSDFQCMVEARPNNAWGYFRMGYATLGRDRNLMATIKWLRLGLYVAQERGDDITACMCVWYIVRCLMSGGEGPSFTAADVNPLMAIAKPCKRNLKTEGMWEFCQGVHTLEKVVRREYKRLIATYGRDAQFPATLPLQWAGSWVSPRGDSAEDELAQSTVSPSAASDAASKNEGAGHLDHQRWPDLSTKDDFPEAGQLSARDPADYPMLQHSSSMPPQLQALGPVSALMSNGSNSTVPTAGAITPPSPIRAPGVHGSEPPKGPPEGPVQVSPTSILDLAASAASWNTGSGSQEDSHGDSQGYQGGCQDSQESSCEGSQGLHDSPDSSEPESSVSTPAAEQSQDTEISGFATVADTQLAAYSSESQQPFTQHAAAVDDGAFHDPVSEGRMSPSDSQEHPAEACEHVASCEVASGHDAAQPEQAFSADSDLSHDIALQKTSAHAMQSHSLSEWGSASLPTLTYPAAPEALTSQQDTGFPSMQGYDADQFCQAPEPADGQQHQQSAAGEQAFDTPQKQKGRDPWDIGASGRSLATHSPSSSLDSSYEAVVHELKDHLAQPSPPRLWATDENSPTRRRRRTSPEHQAADPVRSCLRAIKTGLFTPDRHHDANHSEMNGPAFDEPRGVCQSSTIPFPLDRLEVSCALQNQVPHGNGDPSSQDAQDGLCAYQGRSKSHESNNGSMTTPRSPLQAVSHLSHQNARNALPGRAMQSIMHSPFAAPGSPKGQSGHSCYSPAAHFPPSVMPQTPRHVLPTQLATDCTTKESLRTPNGSGVCQGPVESRARRICSPLPASPAVMGGRVRKASQNMQQALKASPSRSVSPYPGTSPSETPRSSSDADAKLDWPGQDGPGDMQEQLSHTADALWSHSVNLYSSSPSGSAATPEWVQRRV